MADYEFLMDPRGQRSIQTEDDDIFEEAQSNGSPQESYDVEVVSDSPSQHESENQSDHSEPVDQENCEKWHSLIEKVGIRFVLKSLLSQTMTLNETLELLGKHGLQALQSPTNYPSLPSLQRQTRMKQEKLINKSNRVLQQELELELSNNKLKFCDFLDVNKKLANALSKERDRNLFLQEELQRQEQQFQTLQKSKSTIQEDDAYVDEMEQQLQHFRQEVVDTKLAMSDLQVENQELRHQYQQQEWQLEQAMQRAIKLENEFQQLHQQIHQLHGEKLQLQESLTQLSRTPLKPLHSSRQNFQQDFNRQFDEMKSRASSLEQLEAELLIKLDKKESENYQLKRRIALQQEQKEEWESGLQKAQKIIQRLNEKSESDELLIQRLTQDCQMLRRETESKAAKAADLQKCFDDLNARSRHDTEDIHHKMSTEFSELRTAMSEYQQESEQQKQQIMAELQRKNQEIHGLQVELDRNRCALDETRDQTEAEISAKCLQIVELEDQLAAANLAREQLKHEMEDEITRQKQTSQNQVTYLQNRVNDMVAETHNMSAKQPVFVQASPLTQQMRDELNKVLAEVIAVRESLRSAKLPQHIDSCESHQQTIYQNLQAWETKCSQLLKVATKHGNHLDLLHQHFNRMKVVMSAKDQLIGDLNQAIQDRESLHLHEVYSLQVELTQTHKIVYEDMLKSIDLLQQLVAQKDDEIKQEKSVSQEYKQIYLRVLSEKDGLEQLWEENQKQKTVVDKLVQVCKDMMREETGRLENSNDFEIFLARFTSVAQSRQTLIDDLRSAKESIESQKSQRKKDAEEFESRLEKCEEELSIMAKESRQKEEELLAEFSHKEQQLMKQVIEAKQGEERLQQLISHKELMLKQQNDRYKEYQDDVEKMGEKLKANVKEKEELQKRLHQLERDNLLNETQLSQTKETFNLQHIREDELQREKLRLQSQLQERETTLSNLQTQLKERDSELSRTKLEFELHSKSQSQTDLKLQDIQTDYQNLYNEMRDFEETCIRLKADKEKLKRDVDSLIADLANRELQIAKKEQEVKSCRLEVEEMRKKQGENREREVAIETLKSLLRERDQQVQDLRQQASGAKPNCSNVGVQTKGDKANVQMYRVELQKAIQAHDIMAFEATQLRQALSRMTVEQNRLIEDKREFEEIIDRQNSQLHSIKQQNLLSGSNKQTISADSEVLEQIIREKDSYITKLEMEISDMRKDQSPMKQDLHTIGGDSTTRVSNYNTLAGPSREANFRYQMPVDPHLHSQTQRYTTPFEYF